MCLFVINYYRFNLFDKPLFGCCMDLLFCYIHIHVFFSDVSIDFFFFFHFSIKHVQYLLYFSEKKMGTFYLYMQLINDFHDICSFVFKLLYFDCFGGFVCFGWGLFGFSFWKGGGLYLLGFFLWMFWNFEEFTRFANTKLCFLNEIIFTNPYLHVLLLKTIHQQKNQLLKNKN